MRRGVDRSARDIIRNQHRIDVVQFPFHRPHDGLDDFRRERMRPFVVDAQDLMRLPLFDRGHEPLLVRCGPLAIRAHHSPIDSRLVQ
jgi:hypothetical protein